MDVRKDILWRVYLCFLGMILLGIFILLKVFFIQRVEGSYWKGIGDSMHLKYMPVYAERGSIYSEDGNILSTSVPVYDVFIDFGAEGLRKDKGKIFKQHVDSLSLCMSQLFKDKTAEEYRISLENEFNANNRYYLLKRKIDYNQFIKLKDFPLVRLGKNKSGFIFDRRDKRINPYALLAYRTIGVSRENPAQNVGLEQSYDSVLRGLAGQRLVRYTAGAYMPVEGGEVDPIDGRDIVTTLDTYMQDVAEEELMRMLTENRSVHGTAILMETTTGKIKAMANLGVMPDSTYFENMNYGVGKVTEPGSVFKLVTLLSLLEDNYVTNESIVNCEGGVKSFYGLRIADSHRGAGSINIRKAFAISSNVAFAKLAHDYYNNQPEKWYAHLDKFHLTKPTGIDLIASSGKSYIKKPTDKSWQKTTIPFMAHGYEELVSPLQLLMLYNAVANNGKMMKPYLVSAIKENGITVRNIQPEVVVDKICSDQTLWQARECLRAVVDSPMGTAHRVVHDSIYSISGKTGTAVSAINNAGYNKGNKVYQSSFIGFFPSEAPKYAMAVVVQNSNRSKLHYGADVAGRVFKRISDKIFNHYLTKPQPKIQPNKDSIRQQFVVNKKEAKSIFQKLSVPFMDSTPATNSYGMVYFNGSQAMLKPEDTALLGPHFIPDVRGMRLRDAVNVLESRGMVAVVSGRGKVLSQSIPAGEPIAKGQKILLMLN